MCITTLTNRTKSNPNHKPTTIQHTIMNIQLNILSCSMYPDKFIRDNVVAPSVLHCTLGCNFRTAPLPQQAPSHTTKTTHLVTSILYWLGHSSVSCMTRTTLMTSKGVYCHCRFVCYKIEWGERHWIAEATGSDGCPNSKGPQQKRGNKPVSGGREFSVFLW